MNFTATSALNLPPAERHICLFVRELEQFHLALLPLLATLALSPVTVVLALDQVEQRLGQFLAYPAVQQMFKAGRLRPLEAATLFFSEPHFELALVLKRLAHLSVGLEAQPLVVIGEIGRAAQQQPGFNLAHYEAGIENLLAEQPGISLLVCVYGADYCSGEMALAALQTHTAAVIDGVCRAGLGQPRKG